MADRPDGEYKQCFTCISWDPLAADRVFQALPEELKNPYLCDAPQGNHFHLRGAGACLGDSSVRQSCSWCSKYERAGLSVIHQRMR
jgi:hypothetical protein